MLLASAWHFLRVLILAAFAGSTLGFHTVSLALHHILCIAGI